MVSGCSRLPWQFSSVATTGNPFRLSQRAPDRVSLSCPLLGMAWISLPGVPCFHSACQWPMAESSVIVNDANHCRGLVSPGEENDVCAVVRAIGCVGRNPYADVTGFNQLIRDQPGDRVLTSTLPGQPCLGPPAPSPDSGAQAQVGLCAR